MKKGYLISALVGAAVGLVGNTLVIRHIMRTDSPLMRFVDEGFDSEVSQVLDKFVEKWERETLENVKEKHGIDISDCLPSINKEDLKDECKTATENGIRHVLDPLKRVKDAITKRFKKSKKTEKKPAVIVPPEENDIPETTVTETKEEEPKNEAYEKYMRTVKLYSDDECNTILEDPNTPTYEIRKDEFGDNKTGIAITWYLWDDGVLADELDEIVDEEEAVDKLGECWRGLIGNRECIHVRNPFWRSDYCVEREHENYYDYHDKPDEEVNDE